MLIESVVGEWDDIRQRVANERAQLSTPPREVLKLDPGNATAQRDLVMLACVD